jgi:hypothetical protein
MNTVLFCPETHYLFDLCAKARGLNLKRSWTIRPTATGIANPFINKETFNWYRVSELADRHKVMGLTYRTLTERQGISIPEDELLPSGLLIDLKQSTVAKGAIRSLLISEWQKLEIAFKSAGIGVLVFKGPALSLQLFGSPHSREYRDIDLLVDTTDEEPVERVFFNLGYEYANRYPDRRTRHREYVVDGIRHFAFKKKGFPCYFEVHRPKRKMIELAPVPIEEAFGRSERHCFDGVPFPTLSRSDHALLVLIHGTHHGWCQFQWILDAAALLGDCGLDLRLDTPMSWRGEDPAYCLDLFRAIYGQLFETPAPSGSPLEGGRLGDTASKAGGVGSRRLKRRLSALSVTTLRNLSTGGSWLQGKRANFLRIHRYFVQLRRGPRRQLSYLGALIRPCEADFRALGQGRYPLAIYYLTRPFLVLMRIIRRRSRYREVKRV